MKQILLTRGKVALVDDEDFNFLNQWKWFAIKAKRRYYAVRKESYFSGKRKIIFMHRVILKTPQGLETDHKDRNGLNNQRSNIRVCTERQNQGNCGLRKDNVTGYKGVSWWEGRVVVHIKAKGKKLYIGSFPDVISAAHAYDKRAKEIFGEFAGLNFPT